MNYKYYIPIKSVNLSNYYRTAIIAPVNYIDNRNSDIQSQFENNILLSSELFTDKTDCALEIVFDKKEEKPQRISNHFFVFDKPLPISRVKKIYFNSEQQKIATVFNIISGAAFLPLELIQVNSTAERLDTKELNDTSPPKNSKDWKSLLKTYERVLGGLALITISRKEYENYPLNFFAILSMFNKYVEAEIAKQDVKLSDNYSWAFKSESRFKTLHDLIYNEVNSNVVQSLAIKENIKPETRNGLYILDSIPSNTNTYLSAILATYGKHKRKKIVDFISDFQANKFEKKKLEGIALIFGINNGYSSFRNQYKFGNAKIDIKFKLDSKLDFYTIESTYQFIFNGKVNNNSYKYIDGWSPVFENKTNVHQKYFTVLDKHILLEQDKKVNVLNRISAGISALLRKWLPLFDTDMLKEEIESEIKKNLNQYKEGLHKKENDKYSSMLKTKDDEIAALKKKIPGLESDKLKKDNEIATLKKKIQELESDKLKKDKKVETIMIPAQNVEGVKDTIKKTNGELFAQHSRTLTSKEKRADELFEITTLKALKAIAKECGVPKLSTYRKSDTPKLIDEIIKKEFA